MAGRPRTGSIKLDAKGTATASLQSAPGSAKRVTRTFDNLEQAERWLADGLAALKVGAPLPDARAYRTASPSEAPLPGGVSEFAWYWWTKRYLNRTRVSAARL